MGLTRRRLPQPPIAWLRSRFVWLLLLGGIVLLFADLSDVYLWQDEAETGVIARHLQLYGLPLSTDGRDWVQQAPEAFWEFNRDYIWIFHPWLQYFMTAAAFGLLGATTAVARLPFALSGLATVLSLYYFVSRWSQDERCARVASVLLLLYVPFIVLARQCRYYAPSALFTLLTIDSYLWLRSDRPWAMPYFVLSATLLFHSFYGAFFPTLAALMAHAFLACVWRARQGERCSTPTGRFALAVVLIAVLTLPWTSLIPVGRGQANVPSAMQQTAATTARALRWEYLVGCLGYYFLQTTLWVFPLLLVPFLLIAVLQTSRAGVSHDSRNPALRGSECQPFQGGLDAQGGQSSRSAFCQIVGLVIAANVAALSTIDYAFFRYLAHVMPLLLALLGVVVAWFIEHSLMVGYALLAMLVTSNILHILPYRLLSAAIPQQSRVWSEMMASPTTSWLAPIRAIRFRSEPLMYGQELTHSYLGPNEGLVAYLSLHAAPDETVLVNYEDLPLQFYTNLRVLGGFSARGLAPDARPDWLIDRQHGPYRDLLADILAVGSYERITIPYPDIRWENREEARQRHYLTVQSESDVVFYKRRGD